MARQFERYDLKSAPVVDADKRLVGVVTVDDVVEVIQEEAEEDTTAAGRRRRRARRRTACARSCRPGSGGCWSIWGPRILAPP